MHPTGFSLRSQIVTNFRVNSALTKTSSAVDSINMNSYTMTRELLFNLGMSEQLRNHDSPKMYSYAFRMHDNALKVEFYPRLRSSPTQKHATTSLLQGLQREQSFCISYIYALAPANTRAGHAPLYTLQMIRL